MKRWASFSVLLALPLIAHAQEAPPRDPARVSGDLIQIYAGHDDAQIPLRVAAAAKGDKANADYLLAMLKQASADGAAGRWDNGTYYSGDKARPVRFKIAQAVITAGSGDECLDLVLWLIANDPNHAEVTKLAPALARIPAAAKPEVLLKLIDHPNDAVATTAIAIAGTNHVAALADPIAALTGNYRTALRKAALAQADALQFKPLEYAPEKAFSPWLLQQLEIARSRVNVAIPKDALWKRFTFTDQPAPNTRPPLISEFGGWLLGDNGGMYHFVQWNGVEDFLPIASTTIADRTLKEDAELLCSGAATAPANHFYLSMDAASCPQFTMGAWLCERGDQATAAKLLFPLLNRATDQRAAVDAVRDFIGHNNRALMANAMGLDHDYTRATRLASLLGSAAFDGYVNQKEARELALQLGRRDDDFTTLTLVGPDEWTARKAKMTPTEQVKYLADRLRLVTTQDGHGTPTNFSEPQFGNPRTTLAPREQPRLDSIINPYNEILAHKPELADLKPLLPRLLDDNFTPVIVTRMGSPEMSFPRVRDAAAEIFNAVACQKIVDTIGLEALDDKGKKQWLAKISAWVDAHANMSRAEYLLDSLKSTQSKDDFFTIARGLAAIQDKQATPIILKRFNDFAFKPPENAAIAMLLYHFDPDGSVTQAREWLKSSDYRLHFAAALILIQSGNQQDNEGWPDMLSILQQHNSELMPIVFDMLLASPRDDAQTALLAMLKDPGLARQPASPFFLRLLLAGRKEALEFELAQLEDATRAFQTKGQYQGQAVTRTLTRGDTAAQALFRWQTDAGQYPTLAPDELRQTEREKLKTWLTDQFAKITAGKPSELPQAAPLLLPTWSPLPAALK